MQKISSRWPVRVLRPRGRTTVVPLNGREPRGEDERQRKWGLQRPQLHNRSLPGQGRDIPEQASRPPNTMNEADRESISTDVPTEKVTPSGDALRSGPQRLASPPTITEQLNNLASGLELFGFSLAPLYKLWERLQVGHCGQYSVERMLALDEYCQRSSITRAVATCVLFPLGPLLVIIFTECIPLQPPEKGALANYIFWIRHTMMGIILIVCAMSQAKVWIPEMKLSMKKVVVVAIGSASAYTFLNMIAHLWVFPIPFLVVAGAPLMCSIWAMASRIALEPRPMEGIKDGKFRGHRFLLLTSVYAALLGIYPAYQAVFLALNGILQLVVVSAMPLLNLALKNLQTVWGSHLEDSLPQVIVFTVDVFSTIYSVLCMHSANSMKMVLVTVALSTFVLLMNLYGMNHRTQLARAYRPFHGSAFQQQFKENSPLALQGLGDSERLSALVESTIKLLQRPCQLDSSELSHIRLLSGMQHQLSQENANLLQSLASRYIYTNERRSSRTISMGQIKSQLQL